MINIEDAHLAELKSGVGAVFHWRGALDIFVLQRMIGGRRFAFRARLCLVLGWMICAACCGASTNTPLPEPTKKSSAGGEASSPKDASPEDTSFTDAGHAEPLDSLPESSTDSMELPSLYDTYHELRNRAAVDFSPYTETPSWFSDIDPMSWFAAIDQKTPTKGNRIRRRLPRPPFPGFKVVRIRAFELGWWEYAHAMDKNCEFITDKGTFCPKVIAPGKTLTPEQQERLLSIVQDPPRDRKIGKYFRGRPGFRCGNNPAAAFIFYDSKDIPRGVVELTRGCLSWSFEPDVPNTLYSVGGLFEEERAVIKALCDELSLKDCQSYGYYEGPQRQTATVRARRLLPLVLKDPEGVDPGKPLSKTTSAERRTLCVWAWRGLQTATLALNKMQRTMGSEEEISELGASHAIRVLSFEDCIKQFPRHCSSTVAEGLNSLRETASKLAEGRVTLPPVCSFGTKTIQKTQTNKERLIELR